MSKIICICNNIKSEDYERFCEIGNDCGKCLESEDNKKRLKSSQKVPITHTEVEK